MKSPQPSNRFRWVGTLSEEELLGIPASPRPAELEAVPIRNGRPPARRPLHQATVGGRRPRGRDALLVLGVGAAVWLAVVGAGNGLRFPGSASAAPEAVGSITSGVVVERDPIASLPRFNATDRESRAEAGHGQGSGTQVGGEGVKQHNSSPPETEDPTTEAEGGEPAQPPLAEVTLPGVGQVTVEQPELPPIPELPDVENALLGTPTLPLP